MEQLHPEVLLLDLQMPALDGLGALARIHEAGAATAVVVLTGYASDAVERAAVEAGALGCIAKGSTDVVPELLRILEDAARA